MGSSRWKNGTGKSTLLTILAGLQKARRGKVKWNGKVIHKIDSKERFKSIGYVSQHPYYHFTFETVWDEVYERARELYGEQGKEIAEHQLKKFWLYGLKERHPHDCSGESNNYLHYVQPYYQSRLYYYWMNRQKD